MNNNEFRKDEDAGRINSNSRTKDKGRIIIDLGRTKTKDELIEEGRIKRSGINKESLEIALKSSDCSGSFLSSKEGRRTRTKDELILMQGRRTKDE